MTRATNAGGYVLAGGESRRMGRDKALLAWHGTTLVEHIANAVREAVGQVAVVAARGEAYAALGLRTIGEPCPGAGPLSGVAAALADTAFDYNLIVACDMPNLTADALRQLMQAAMTSQAPVCAVRSAHGIEPLCAVYHRKLRAAAEHALQRGERTMVHLLAKWKVTEWTAPEAALTRNLNTADDFAELLRAGN